MNNLGMAGSFWGLPSMGVLRLQCMRVVVSKLLVAERKGFEHSLLRYQEDKSSLKPGEL